MLGRDLLVVISDSGKLSILTFCNEMHRFYLNILSLVILSYWKKESSVDSECEDTFGQWISYSYTYMYMYIGGTGFSHGLISNFLVLETQGIKLEGCLLLILGKMMLSLFLFARKFINCILREYSFRLIFKAYIMCIDEISFWLCHMQWLFHSSQCIWWSIGPVLCLDIGW